MSCRLIQNINHSCEYNPGGIKDIYLLDIRDFINYQFLNDGLFDSCLVESISISALNYITLDSVNESNFIENYTNNIYRQSLTTFVRTLNNEKTSNLLLASSNKYLIIFRNYQGRSFTFGSDGGALINYTQQTGQTGEVEGYSITITKNSIYPLFEIDIDNTQYISRIFNDSFNNKFD